jgi:hypothetical protein
VLLDGERPEVAGVERSHALEMLEEESVVADEEKRGKDLGFSNGKVDETR